MGMMIFIGGFVIVCVFHAAFGDPGNKAARKEVRKAAKMQTIERQNSARLIITEDNNGISNDSIPVLDFSGEQE